MSCDRCGGGNIAQSAFIMVHLSDRKHRTFWLDRDDVQWEDYFYCWDCEDEVTVTEQEAAR